MSLSGFKSVFFQIIFVFSLYKIEVIQSTPQALKLYENELLYLRLHFFSLKHHTEKNVFGESKRREKGSEKRKVERVEGK